MEFPQTCISFTSLFLPLFLGVRYEFSSFTFLVMKEVYIWYRYINTHTHIYVCEGGKKKCITQSSVTHYNVTETTWRHEMWLEVNPHLLVSLLRRSWSRPGHIPFILLLYFSTLITILFYCLLSLIVSVFPPFNIQIDVFTTNRVMSRVIIDRRVTWADLRYFFS